MKASKTKAAWAIFTLIAVLVVFGLIDCITTVLAEEPKEPRIEDVTFVASCDGTEQKYVLLYPPGFDSTRSCSLLIALHGHGSDRWQFIQQPRDECRAVREVAAAHGLLLVSPDYRASTSWMGPKAESDLLQIIRSLKERLSIDRVILCGGSMGGTGALTFTALHPDLIDGVVSLNGTANLVEYEGFSDAIAESFGGTRSDIPNEYRKRSAEFFPEKFQVPIACTTGGQDTIVPPDSVLRLLKEITRHNPHVLNLHRPEGGHSTNDVDTQAALEFVIAQSKH
ncbi:MAG: alpha/beta fold hydrolase [Planctomycetaceae bacterium]|nr:alpha/beta fold hydrolase [Planctomycetaceae bacterium]